MLKISFICKNGGSGLESWLKIGIVIPEFFLILDYLIVIMITERSEERIWRSHPRCLGTSRTSPKEKVCNSVKPIITHHLLSLPPDPETQKKSIPHPAPLFLRRRAEEPPEFLYDSSFLTLYIKIRENSVWVSELQQNSEFRSRPTHTCQITNK